MFRVFETLKRLVQVVRLILFGGGKAIYRILLFSVSFKYKNTIAGMVYEDHKKRGGIPSADYQERANNQRWKKLLEHGPQHAQKLFNRLWWLSLLGVTLLSVFMIPLISSISGLHLLLNAAGPWGVVFVIGCTILAVGILGMQLNVIPDLPPSELYEFSEGQKTIIISSLIWIWVIRVTGELFSNELIQTVWVCVGLVLLILNVMVRYNAHWMKQYKDIQTRLNVEMV